MSCLFGEDFLLVSSSFFNFQYTEVACNRGFSEKQFKSIEKKFI
jgi:hypothetical protein